MYIVVRFNINKQEQEAHSLQKYDDVTTAMKRFYSILATDIDNDNYLYELVQVVCDNGLIHASQVFDNRIPEPEFELEPEINE